MDKLSLRQKCFYYDKECEATDDKLDDNSVRGCNSCYECGMSKCGNAYEILDEDARKFYNMTPQNIKYLEDVQ